MKQTIRRMCVALLLLEQEFRFDAFLRGLMRSLVGGVIVVFLVGSSVRADTLDQPAVFTTQPVRDPWHIDWININRPTTSVTSRSLMLHGDSVQQPADQVHAVAIEHSDAYQTRAKIHKYASVATLPLFAGELILGQSLYNSSTRPGSKRGLHAAIGGGIIGLFGLNTVTGAWNLFGEGWQEKDGRTLRLVHGLLMMAADAGFVETWATGPHSGRLRTALTYEHDKMVHRNIAVASIGVGTAGYLIMLLANHH